MFTCWFGCDLWWCPWWLCVAGICLERELRQQIEQLQRHRRNGLKTLNEVKRFEQAEKQRANRQKSREKYVSMRLTPWVRVLTSFLDRFPHLLSCTTTTTAKPHQTALRTCSTPRRQPNLGAIDRRDTVNASANVVDLPSGNHFHPHQPLRPPQLHHPSPLPPPLPPPPPHPLLLRHL